MTTKDSTSEQQEAFLAAMRPADEGPPSHSGDEAAADLEKKQKRLLVQREAVNHDPRNVVLLNELGLVAEEAGDYDRAYWAYRRAIRLDLTFGPAYQNLGLLYQREGRNKQAIGALENCLRYAGRDCDRQAVETSLRDLHRTESKPRPGEENQLVREVIKDKEEATETAGEPAHGTPAKEIEGPAAPGAQDATINPALTQPLEDLGLTPAEALMLLDPEGSNGREMLRYTALDLVNKGVLEVSDSGQIGRGRQFDQASLEGHESMLANYFARFELGIDLARYADAILVRLNNRTSTFKTLYVRQVMLDKGYMQVETERWLGFIPVRRYVLSQDGLRVMHELKRQLKNSQSQIRRLIRRDPELAKAYLAKAGPALVLLEDNSQMDFQEWRRLLEVMGFDDHWNENPVNRIPRISSLSVDEIIKFLLGE